MLLRICFFCLFAPLLHAWTHLELGAANYGASKSPKRHHDPNVQYKVLFWTVEELISRFGDEGVFYVNDIDPEACHYCAELLKSYIELHAYTIEVVSLPCDYKTLQWEGPLFDSIHLKNPEAHFFYKPEETRTFLKELASYSNDGLYLFILYSDSFFPKAEKAEFVHKGKFYHQTAKWKPVIYYGPSGKTIQNGQVFQIFPTGE